MAEMMRALMAALPGLGSVCALMLFFISFFSIFGLKMWSGQLKGRCSLDPDRYCITPQHESAPRSFTEACPAVLASVAGGSGVAVVQPDGVCVEDANPMRGAISFDNMLVSMLTVFQVPPPPCICLE